MIPRRLRRGPPVSRRPHIGPPLWGPIVDEVADVDWSHFKFDLRPCHDAGLWAFREWSADQVAP